MPHLLPNGIPERTTRSRFDFSQWADGQAWKFLRGEDYTTTTDSFRYAVKRWARSHGYEIKTLTLPATDEHGRALPATKAEPVGVAVCLTRNTSARAATGGATRPREAPEPTAA